MFFWKLLNTFGQGAFVSKNNQKYILGALTVKIERNKTYNVSLLILCPAENMYRDQV